MQSRSVTSWILQILLLVSLPLAVALVWLDHAATTRILAVAQAERLVLLQRQAAAMLHQDAAAMATIAYDYSAWDAAYEFVAGTNPAFIKSDLGAELHESLNVEHYLYVDAEGRVLVASSQDQTGTSEVERVDALRRLAMMPMAEADRAKGLLAMIGGAPALVGIGRVVPTDLSRSEIGRVVFVRMLDAPELQSYWKILGVRLEIVWHGDPDTGPLTWEPANGSDTHVAQLNLWDQGRVRGEVRLPMQDRLTPALMGATREVRVAAVLGGLMALITIAWLLWRRVALPLRVLHEDVRQSRAAKDLSWRVRESTAFSEVQSLSQALNEMLAERQRRQEQDREQEAERRASQLKSRFLATMSHEIRTPLSGLLGAIDMLRRHPDQDAERYLGMADQASQHLLNLINDVLDFSRIEAGQFNLKSEPSRLSQLIEQSVDVIRHPAESKHLSLHVDLPTALDGWLLVDPVRIRQILINLLSNAVKFSSQGEIRVEVREQEQVLQIAVMDRGIGIPPELLEEIFAPFRQLNNSLTGEHGTGLGLAISRELARMHGGDLHANVRDGGGTVILLTLPSRCRCQAPVAGSNDVSSETQAPRIGAVILVAEDDELSRLIVVAALTQAGYQVDAVDNGDQAVQAALNRPYDLILMDRHMPVCDGIEATRRIREAHDSPNRSTPVIALTASTLKDDREACLRAGMNDFIGKPLTPVQLERVVADLLARHGRPGTASDAPTLVVAMSHPAA